VRGPSFGNLQAVPEMVEGTLIADVIASIGSMDFVLGTATDEKRVLGSGC
jgi:NADH:ubiquinone oxidoreductase subunit D